MSGYRRYADLRVGSRFPSQPARYDMTAETVAAYRSIALGSSPVGDAAKSDVAPPTLAAVYIRPAQNALNGPPGGIHAKQQFEFFAAVKIGDTLETHRNGLFENRRSIEIRARRNSSNHTRRDRILL